MKYFIDYVKPFSGKTSEMLKFDRIEEFISDIPGVDIRAWASFRIYEVDTDDYDEFDELNAEGLDRALDTINEYSDYDTYENKVYISWNMIIDTDTPLSNKEQDSLSEEISAFMGTGISNFTYYR